MVVTGTRVLVSAQNAAGLDDSAVRYWFGFFDRGISDVARADPAGSTWRIPGETLAVD
jgi:hypothetical protein